MSVFIDEAEIVLKAGDGGNGAVSFRREKHVPRGGPDGGDGGRGGSIIIETDPHLATLLDFRPGKIYKAGRGADGMPKNQYGKDGADLVLKVPIGTQVLDAESGHVLVDMTRQDQREVLAKGGQGGRGNSHFVTSVQQAPRFGEKGEPGDEKRVRMELKLLADVGLLGFPNVGKSTLLSRVSAARPKIADYPFTTLVPNLGVVKAGDYQFVLADIPGLIENAHQGAGLGVQFLKHLERTRLLIHLVDVADVTGRDPIEDYRTINRELALFRKELSHLPQVVALSRIDVVPDRETLKPLIAFLESEGHSPVFAISSVTGEGIEPLVYHVADLLQKMPPRGQETAPASGTVHITLDSRGSSDDPRHYTIRREDDVLVVAGRGIERMIAMTDMENEMAVRRLQRRLDRMGVFAKLKAAGAAEGDTVRIRDIEFDYIDEDAEDILDEEDEE